nr:hypothetical protein CFP56_46548 [Quercus suber]
MYGGSSKLGRGAGAGGVSRGAGAKRLSSSYPLPPTHRPTGGPPSSSRLSLGGRGSGSASNHPRSRSGAGSSAAAPMTEENFSLVSGNNPLAFGMIIRLVPDLVEEIRRVEAQGGTARVKFDANANNSAGNVIDVGGKQFRFTWSRDGDLCDIYEERRSGEDGNGLLVESGCAWRKLNVQRVLDESTKNHVKKMSEEAERKLKSRKAIVLEHGNPSMKSQLKALAAVEANPWKHFKQKKEPPFKKRKVEPPQASVPPKSVHKSGLSSTATAKGRHSSSPRPSPPEQSVLPVSPLRNVNMPKHQAVEDLLPNKETSGRKRNVGAKPVDLQSMLITLLMENPKGMSLKALEKAIGDTIPNSVKKIEPIIKKIATFQAPGRYFLKPGVDQENIKKPLSESGSSPEDNLQLTPAAEDKHGQIPAAEPGFEEKVPSDELEEPAHLNSKLGEESNALEKIDIQQHSPDLKEASDVDVDIMTSDDDKEPQRKVQPSEPGFSSPNPWIAPDGKPMQSGIGEKQDGGGSDAIEIEKDSPDDELETEIAAVSSSVPDKESKKRVEETKPFSPVQDDLLDRQHYIGSLFDERENTVNDSLRHEQSDSSERTFKGKSRKSSDVKKDEKFDRSKRIKTDAQLPMSGVWNNQFSEGSHNLSPDRLGGNPSKGPTIQTNRTDRDGNTDIGLQKGYNQAFPGKSSSDIQQSGRRSFDQSTRAKAPDAVERHDKRAESLGRGRKYSEKNSHAHESFSLQKDKFNRDTQNEDGYANEKKGSKNLKEVGAGGKQSVPFDSRHRKHGEVGRSKEGGQVSSHLIGSSPKDNVRAGVVVSPVVNGKGSMLQRELSDLELGELREPLPEETPVKKQFEKSSFKQSENKLCSSDNWNSDSIKGKPVGKTTLEPGKPSPPNLNAGLHSNLEGSNKKRNVEDHAEDLTRSHHRVVQSHPQYLSKVDHAEDGPQYNKLADGSNKSRQNEGNISQGIGLEGFSESNKKAPVSALQQHDTKQGLVSHSIKEMKKQTSNTIVELNDGRKDSVWAEGNNSDRKRRDSSSDENSCSYSKYEKDEPELKGPIKDLSQHKEYVQEYRDKYDSYCSLNKILESYRNEFQKLGKDLEFAKVRGDKERYYDILAQLKESYQLCGTRHKRLKKIFVVLHEELKHLKQRIKDFALSYAKED